MTSCRSSSFFRFAGSFSLLIKCDIGSPVPLATPLAVAAILGSFRSSGQSYVRSQSKYEENQTELFYIAYDVGLLLGRPDIVAYPSPPNFE